MRLRCGLLQVVSACYRLLSLGSNGIGRRGMKIDSDLEA